MTTTMAWARPARSSPSRWPRPRRPRPTFRRDRTAKRCRSSRRFPSKRPRPRKPSFQRTSRNRSTIPIGSSPKTSRRSRRTRIPKIAAVETPAAEASPQSVATARQTLDEDAREAEKALAPVLGLGKDILRITTDWNRKISAHLTAHKVNPEGKQPNNQKVKVSFAINRRGNVLSVDVVESSGDVAYDAAALSIVRKSDPIPQPPGRTDRRPVRAAPSTSSSRRRTRRKRRRSAQRQ